MLSFNIDQDSKNLINSLKPFISKKDQDMIDMFITAVEIFQPPADKPINTEAIEKLFTMISAQNTDYKSNQPEYNKEDDYIDYEENHEQQEND